MSERQTVAGAYDKIESHEEICAVRYKAIADGHTALKDAIAELKDGITGSKKTLDKAVWLALTTLIGMVGWLGAQLFAASDHIPDPVAAVQAIAP